MLTGQWSALAQAAEAFDLSRAEISDAAIKGAVWKKKSGKHAKLLRIRDLEKDAGEGETLYINYNREVLEQTPEVPRLLSDQGNYSIWYKPSGMLSQGSKWSDHCTITSTAAAAIVRASGQEKKCLLVHRLDRAARGLIILAHTKNACKALAALFEQRKVVKKYHAVVHGVIDQSVPWSLDTPVDGKTAETVVLEKSLLKDKNQSQLTVDIKTGRKHQIRSHLAGAGFPVVGDRLFDPDREHQSDLQLAAFALQFVCPFNGKPQHVELDDSLLLNPEK